MTTPVPSKDLLSKLRAYHPTSGYARVMREAADEIERLQWDIIAYQGALGHAIPGNHDGKLRDGTVPRNALADFIQKHGPFHEPPAECAGCVEHVRMQHDIASLLGVDADTDSIDLHGRIYGALSSSQPPRVAPWLSDQEQACADIVSDLTESEAKSLGVSVWRAWKAGAALTKCEGQS